VKWGYDFTAPTFVCIGLNARSPLWHAKAFRNRATEPRKVASIPREYGVSFSLECASRDEGIVNRSANDAVPNRVSDRRVILVAGERDKGKALANIVEKEQHLLATQAMSSGQPCHSGVHLGQAVRGAEIAPFVGVHKSLPTSFVMPMVFNENRD
jgi:hypothetical protein